MSNLNHAVVGFIEDLLHTTDPSRQIQGGRRHARHNRTLPALLFPWLNDVPLTDEPVMTTTKDISTGGGSLLLQQEFRWDDFLIALPYGKVPVFVLSKVRHRTPLVFGFWQLGVQWQRLIPPTECPALQPIAELMLQLQASIEAAD